MRVTVSRERDKEEQLQRNAEIAENLKMVKTCFGRVYVACQTISSLASRSQDMDASELLDFTKVKGFILELCLLE